LSKKSEEPSIESIRSVSIFSGLKERQLKSIARECKSRSFKAGEAIVKEGESGAGFYLITDGSVDVRRRGKTISKLGKGDFFGEMTLLDNQPRSADVIAATDTICSVLTGWSFVGLLRSKPDIGVNMIKELIHRLRGTDKALTE
jgi:CRP/FNR family cyclic AMP-dependent transcriptional regulator